MAQLILILAPFQTLNINEVTLLDITIVFIFFSYFIKNEIYKFLDLIKPNIIILSILIIGIFTAYINSENTSLTWLISIKIIEFYYFFRIAYKIKIDEDKLIQAIIFCISVILIWVVIHQYLFITGFTRWSRPDLPFEFEGGQQLPCALFILNALYFFMIRRKYGQILYLKIIPVYILSLFASIVSQGRAGLLAMLLFIFLISNFRIISFISISLIPMFYLVPPRLIENSFFKRIKILDMYLGSDLVDVNATSFGLTAKLSSIFFGYGIGIMSIYEIFTLHVIYETGLISFLILGITSFVFYFPNIKNKEQIYLFFVYLLVVLQLSVSEAIFTNKLAPLFCFSMGTMHYLSRYKSIKF